MAYRRTSKTTKIAKVRTTTTQNTKGGTTTSVGKRNGHQRLTRSHNSKTGVTTQTTTRNLGNGYIERKTVRLGQPKPKPINWSKLFGVSGKSKTKTAKPTPAKAQPEKVATVAAPKKVVKKSQAVIKPLSRKDKIVLWSFVCAVSFVIISFFT
jgi:hypothetical protein